MHQNDKAKEGSLFTLLRISGVARAFQGGRIAHPTQNVKENEQNLRKINKN